MKILVQQQELLETLDVVSKSLYSNPQLPILSSVLLKTDTKSVVISATDLYFGVNSTITAQVEKPGAVAILGKEFRRIIAGFGPGEVIIEKKSQSLVEIKSGQSSFNIQILNDSEFPDFPPKPKDELIISTKELEQINNLVTKSASSDQTRPILTSVLFTQENSVCHTICTDGFRLSKLSISPLLKQDGQLLFPAKTISEILRVALKQGLKNLKITSSAESKQAVITVGKYDFYIRLIDGDFPPYQKIIPSSATTTLWADADDLLENFKRTALLTEKQQSISQLVISKGQVEIKASASSLGSYQSLVNNVKTEGLDLAIAFNTQYILDFLLSIKDATNKNVQIKLECTEPTKPALFTSPEIPEFIYVVMPFRVI